MKRFLKGVIYHALFVFTLFIFSSNNSLALENQNAITVSGVIGENMVTIFGYTSPFAKVELTSINVLAFTQSQENGYFEFNQTLLPKHPSDLCIRAIDESNLSTNPICIPPPPETNYHTHIGPLILPPTLALNSDAITAYQNVALSGQAIPGSTVTLNFYQKDDSPQILPKPAHALSLPKLTLPVDFDDHWSINLPTSYSTSYRFYAATLFADGQSSLSHALQFTLPSLWLIYWLQYRFYLISFFVLLLTLLLLVLLVIADSRKQSRLNPAAYNPYIPHQSS